MWLKNKKNQPVCRVFILLNPNVQSTCFIYRFNLNLWPCTVSVTFNLWSLHYMQMLRSAGVFIVELSSGAGCWVGSIGRSDGAALTGQKWKYAVLTGSLAGEKNTLRQVRRIKCRAGDRSCRNNNCSQSLDSYFSCCVRYFQPNTFFSALWTARIVNLNNSFQGRPMQSLLDGPPCRFYFAFFFFKEI